MPLTETNVVSVITILEDGQIEVRRSRRIFDGPTMIAETYHRGVLEPGQDVSQEAARVRAVTAAMWTPAVVAAFVQAQRDRRRPA